MKGFKFSLTAVMGYKEQVLEGKKREHAFAVQVVAEKEKTIKRLESECDDVIEDFNERKLEGMTIIDAQSYEIHIYILQKNIEKEYKLLAELQRIESEKREEVVVAKQEVSALEKLRDKRLNEYNRAVLKEEELFIEELITNQRATAAEI